MKTWAKWIVGGLAIVLALAACGDGETQEGVALRPVGEQAATPTLTPEPTAEAAEGAAQLTGRLLVLKGNTFEVLDLATGETTALEGAAAFSSAVLNADRTRGVFVAFPNFGLLDLVRGETAVLESGGSQPIGLGIAPDGQSMVALTGGGYITQLWYGNLETHTLTNIAGSSQTGYQWVWDTDSQLVWWATQAPDEVMRFDPASGESVPYEPETVQVAGSPLGSIAPGGARLAIMPIAPDVAGQPAGEEVCVESEVHLYPTSMSRTETGQAAEVAWTEPGLVASSPVWLDDDTLLFVKLGNGACGVIEGEPLREIMLLDLGSGAAPRTVAGPIGNADDTNDEEQRYGRQFGHLYSVSPDGRYVAWVAGGRAADESLINVTEIETGATQAVLRYGADEATDAVDFIENTLIRQVVWLE